MRDMAANLGGLLMGCYICEKKPPKLQAISLRRFRSLLPLVRFAQPAEVRLRKTQAFFSAQNDLLIVCFVVCVRFREHQGAPLPVEMKRTEIRSFSGGGTPPLQGILRSALYLLSSFPIQKKRNPPIARWVSILHIF